MKKTLVLAANAGRARFFIAESDDQPWQEIHDMVNQPARQRDADLETDRMGPTSAGKSLHNTGGALPNKTYQPAQSPTEHLTDKFARDINDYLAPRQRAGEFSQLVVSAPPQFLGLLRQLLDPHVRALATLEINKDYTQLRPDELRQQIAQQQGQQGQQGQAD